MKKCVRFTYISHTLVFLLSKIALCEISSIERKINHFKRLWEMVYVLEMQKSDILNLCLHLDLDGYYQAFNIYNVYLYSNKYASFWSHENKIILNSLLLHPIFLLSLLAEQTTTFLANPFPLSEELNSIFAWHRSIAKPIKFETFNLEPSINYFASYSTEIHFFPIQSILNHNN